MMNEPTMDNIEIGPSLRRRMTWDIVACEDARKILNLLGLTPGSEDGEEREHTMSHARLSRLDRIDSWVILTSEVAGEVMTRAILNTHGIDAESAVGQHQMEHYKNIAKATSIAVIANLLDYGVLDFGTGGVRV